MLAKIKTVNIKFDQPSVDKARKRLIEEIGKARREGKEVLKLIHGYGSSGVGGKLQTAIRKSLQHRKREGKVKRYVYGERWNTSDELTQEFLLDHWEFRRDPDLDQYNRGITILEISIEHPPKRARRRK